MTPAERLLMVAIANALRQVVWHEIGGIQYVNSIDKAITEMMKEDVNNGNQS